MLKLLHSKQIKNSTKSTSVTKKAATIKNTNGAACPSYRCRAHQLSSEKWNILYASLSTILDSLHTNMNQDLVKKHLCNQGSHYEK